jgi:hypothetical protein
VCGKDIGAEIGLCQSCRVKRNQHSLQNNTGGGETNSSYRLTPWICWAALAVFAACWYARYHFQQLEQIRKLSAQDETAPGEPLQQNVRLPSWQHGSYTIKPLASYDIKAQVLLQETYRLGREADLSPLDLTLAWGPLSSARARKNLSFSHSYRYYSWYAQEMGVLTSDFINSHVANVHLIPSDAGIKERLMAVEIGDVVHLSGFLVKVEGDDGWSWTSSTSRDDSGMGACELMWVTKIT